MNIPMEHSSRSFSKLISLCIRRSHPPPRPCIPPHDHRDQCKQMHRCKANKWMMWFPFRSARQFEPISAVLQSQRFLSLAAPSLQNMGMPQRCLPKSFQNPTRKTMTLFPCMRFSRLIRELWLRVLRMNWTINSDGWRMLVMDTGRASQASWHLPSHRLVCNRMSQFRD